MVPEQPTLCSPECATLMHGLVILERCVPNLAKCQYRVTCHAEACTTGSNTSHLPEPKAVVVVWAESHR